MDGKLIEELLRELDRKFAFEGRNVAFVIDKIPSSSHPHIDNFQDPTNGSRCHPLIESKIPQECCPENYSKSREEKNPSENFVAVRNANVSLSLGCTIEANNRELFSKVWNIHRKPGSRHSRR